MIFAFPIPCERGYVVDKSIHTDIRSIQITEQIDRRTQWDNAQVLLPDQGFFSRAESWIGKCIVNGSLNLLAVSYEI